MNSLPPSGFGWIPDVPDVRDYTFDHPDVRRMLAPLESRRVGRLPPRYAWRETSAEPRESEDDYEYWGLWPAVQSQAGLRTSSVHSVLALVQYMQRRAMLPMRPPSRMFVYNAVRQALGFVSDSGAPIRDVLKAVIRFGTPPEHHWPYDAHHLDAAPPPELYSYEETCSAAVYVRLDAGVVAGADLLTAVKHAVVAGFPCVFGFPAYSSIAQGPAIPLPGAWDTLLGGQSAVVVGYSDDRRSSCGTTGQLVIRSSWGTEWGLAGYGHLPYEYVLRGWARDFWTLCSPEWLSRNGFGHPVPDGGASHPGRPTAL